MIISGLISGWLAFFGLLFLILLFQGFLGFFEGRRLFAWEFRFRFRHLAITEEAEDLLFIQGLVLQQGFSNQLVLLAMRFDDVMRLLMGFGNNAPDFIINGLSGRL